MLLSYSIIVFLLTVVHSLPQTVVDSGSKDISAVDSLSEDNNVPSLDDDFSLLDLSTPNLQIADGFMAPVSDCNRQDSMKLRSRKDGKESACPANTVTTGNQQNPANNVAPENQQNPANRVKPKDQHIESIPEKEEHLGPKIRCPPDYPIPKCCRKILSSTGLRVRPKYCYDFPICGYHFDELCCKLKLIYNAITQRKEWMCTPADDARTSVRLFRI